jgi:5-methylcytosine-specific restriction endonuclease McrA
MAARLKREARVCAICGLPIDPELKSPHPLSFSVDHVTPVSMGGVVAEGWNLRAAHRICNMKRGTGRGNAKSEGDRSSSW